MNLIIETTTKRNSRGRFGAALILAAIAGVALWSYSTGGIVQHFLDSDVKPEVRLERIRAYFDEWGASAVLVYIGLVVLETVIAPIPGILLYMPGGAVFGWMLGGFAALVGNILGSGVACSLARGLVGRRWKLMDVRNLKKYQGILETRGFWIVLLLRLNPLTSSDMVSYAAGVTGIPLWKVMTATGIGMAPLCFLQAYFAQELFDVFPVLIYPLLLVMAGYVVYVVRIVRRPVAEETN